MADKPVEQPMHSVPFDADLEEQEWLEKCREVDEGCQWFKEKGYSFSLGCGTPRLNPNGSLMLDEDGKEMYLPGNEPSEEPDE